MIPLKGDNPTKSFPIVTIILIILNVTVFIFQVLTASGNAPLTAKLAVIPADFFSYEPGIFSTATYTSINPYATLITYAFLHGGILHLAFNMLFLWIFGNNVEDYFGKIRFIVFYLLCGVAAALTHIFMNADSTLPMVGASGAIAGILGAYMVLFPRAQIHTLFIFFFIVRIIKVPAVFFIGFWFFIQILSVTGGSEGAVAWYAHIGGFIAGIALLFVMGKKKGMKRKLRAV